MVSNGKTSKVNDAYKHGRCEKNWLKSLHAMSNVEVSATQNRRTNVIHYIHVLPIWIKNESISSMMTGPLLRPSIYISDVKYTKNHTKTYNNNGPDLQQQWVAIKPSGGHMCS